MSVKVVLWDYNGCLLDDCEYIYEQGPVRIFKHFNLPAPDLEAYRNEVTSDFMRTFYWKYGIPEDVTAKDLDAIMKAGIDVHGEPPIQPDSKEVLEAVRQKGVAQHLVTGYASDLLVASMKHHGITHYFGETHGSSRNKVPIFEGILERAGCSASEAIGVTDTLSDVVKLESIGVRTFICPRGFQGPPRINGARGEHPNMVVIDDLRSLLQYL